MQLSSIQQIRTIKLKAATLLFPKGVNSIGLGFPLGLGLKPIAMKTTLWFKYNPEIFLPSRFMAEYKACKRCLKEGTTNLQL